MEMKLLSLNIENFKGIKAAKYVFSDKTMIKGANATGKTSIFDAFSWLFFNKDSSGAEKFSVRPLDKNGKPKNEADIRVSAVISVDGTEWELCKTQRKEAGSNKNLFMINGFPFKEKDFRHRIEQIIDEEVFKLLTSPTYFLSLNWKKQREILTRFAGDISDTAFAEQLGGYDSLIPMLGVAPTLDELQKNQTALIKKLKSNLNDFFIRIDELEKIKLKLTGDIEAIDERIAELRASQKHTAQDMADAERFNYLLEQFIKEKTENISGIINSQFDGVSFKLFDTQVNGEIKDCCEMAIEGVPYSSLNAGHRIAGGLKIIKALQKLYNAYLPVWTDNAESVNDFNIPDMDCQLILLSVSKNKQLKVEGK